MFLKNDNLLSFLRKFKAAVIDYTIWMLKCSGNLDEIDVLTWAEKEKLKIQFSFMRK
jgi:hypothetical protein